MHVVDHIKFLDDLQRVVERTVRTAIYDINLPDVKVAKFKYE